MHVAVDTPMSEEISAARAELEAGTSTLVHPGSFEPQRHFYPRVVNAQIHPLVAYVLRMSHARLIERYCHLHPRVDRTYLAELLAEPTRYVRWAGADLFCTTTAAGNRRLVVLETNTCPSGNKSMPLLNDEQEQAGYRTVIERAFLPSLHRRGRVDGGLAVLFDKNYTEASGYAAVIADLTGESVHLTPMRDDDSAPARFRGGVLEVRSGAGEWQPMRAAFRYVTQRPWATIPVKAKTRILNPVVACLAGGRNKLVANTAYNLFNAELESSGLQIYVPETIGNVAKPEIPLLTRRFGGHAVVKIPYSNAGQGVFPILSPRDLESFMCADHGYDRYVVQSLIGNYSWSSEVRAGRYYHVGTMPDRHGHIYVADLRMMVCSGEGGMRPVAVYARRAEKPLPQKLDAAEDSWAILGTNLSRRTADGSWASDTDRLLLMDRRDFNAVGIGGDDLIEAFVQTVLCVKAIDRMAQTLLTKKGELRMKLFRSLDDDASLIDEIQAGMRGAEQVGDDVA
jgi:hypothetical protein